MALCIVAEKDFNYSTPITQVLEPWVKVARHVYALTFQQGPNFKGDGVMIEGVNSNFIRAVNSTLDYIKELEVPNIVSGVSAGLISYCQIHKKEASCYIFFLETLMFDSITVKPIRRLLKDLKIPCDKSYTYKHHETSSLYL